MADGDRPPVASTGSSSGRSVDAPAVSLPKGGGAIRGIGEKFATNPVTGTGSITVPVATSPGRAGFGPDLSLSYDSGAGNGPFGVGWKISLPSISRKTDNGVPRYRHGPDEDVFVLSDAEDLVPVYRQAADGAWVRGQSGALVIHEDEVDGYCVRRFRPRIEGLFARVERWSRIGDPADVHWRSISKGNVLTVYGRDAGSRIADPLDASRIFSWLICETRDDRGNAVVYRYKAEDGTGVDLGRPHERNRGPRDDPERAVNRYPKRIMYGNRGPLLDALGDRPRFVDGDEVAKQIEDDGWMFEVVFDYGDHDLDMPGPRDDEVTGADGAPTYPWSRRSDAFSSRRSGFEVRTSRTCQRVLLFHHFPGTDDDGVGTGCLVRSTDLTYSDEVDPTDVRNPVYTLLRAVTQSGYRRRNGGYDRSSLPPAEFEYTEPVVHNMVEQLDRGSLEHVPAGLNDRAYRWADLHGEGVSGVLTEQAGAWFYKRNLSPAPVGGSESPDAVRARLGPLESVVVEPRTAIAAGAQILDLAGDGLPDVVVLKGPSPGLYEHDAEEGWQPFRPFTSRIGHDVDDPNVRFVDVDGDGHADVLVTADDALVWHQSLAEEGFGPARRVANALGEEHGPRVVFGDATQSIHLADLSGDGLSDIVRVRNGHVCYWPSLGHGRFGAKVTMDNAPWFDHPEQFDNDRVRLADIDGSGTTDILYLHRDGVRVYFNQSGNSWSRAHRVESFPRLDDVVDVRLADLLGNGTACLVWSSSLPSDARSPMKYVSLMGRDKPHLLVRTHNNLGAETRVTYAPSTRFYLEDKQAGRPWITRLPFPVHVVERIDTYDHVSRSRFTSRFAYHHGYFDGAEREFRGFGMVEQWDTAELAALGDGSIGQADNVAGDSHVPPIRTRTWFHTGTHLASDKVSLQFEQEYFREPGVTVDAARSLLLNDASLPPGLAVDDERDACRALRGSMLRKEVYADDAGPDPDNDRLRRAGTPYSVVEQSFAVRLVQPRGNNHHAVFHANEREVLSYHYERDPSDPRVKHALTLEVDDHGNVLKQADVAYGRRATVRTVGDDGTVQQVPNPGLAALHPADRTKQTTTLIAYTANTYTNLVDTADVHRLPLPCETRTFELTGYTPTGAAGRFQASDLVEPDPARPGRLRHRFRHDVAYEAAPVAGDRCRRIVEWTRTLYRGDDLSGLLPLGQLQGRALPGESYKLAFTPGLLAQVFQRPRPGQAPEALLPEAASVLDGQGGDRGGYVVSQDLAADGRFPASEPDDHWWVPSGRSFFSSDPADSAAIELSAARQHFFLTRRTRDPFGQDAFTDYDPDDLLVTETRDALGNRTSVVANDYRVLRARLISDPNGNRSEAVYNTLGMVVGTAVGGKPPPAPVEGDSLVAFVADLTDADCDAFFGAPDPHAGAATLLQDATTRVVYDLERFRRTRQANPQDPTQWRPACAATIARETHASAPTPPDGLHVQVTFAYSDGFGREIQQKIQAEPGPLAEGGALVDPRWVGSGWTIFNNKGKPVRQYEPFFSATHGFEYGAIVGVSPVLFYDPVDRVVATLHPNHTFEKVVFDPWHQAIYDANDTCAPRNAQTGDPRTDPDIAGYVAPYFDHVLPAPPAPEWQTWHAARIGGALGADEQLAASRAAAHADTPRTVHFDVLGRPFLTVARNRVVCQGHDHDGEADTLTSRVDLDIEGNQRAVRDADAQADDPLGRVVARYAYDLLGNRIHQRSMEAGASWTLDDAAGNAIRAWDSRGHDVTTTYDQLRRPLRHTVRGTTAESDPRTLNQSFVVDRVEYGEGHPSAEALNLRTRVVHQFDGAGVVTHGRLAANGAVIAAYDFKGNVLHVTRRLLSDHTALADWAQNPQLQSETFETTTRYDALNRAVQSIAPHSSSGGSTRHVVQRLFNDANLLERVDVWLERAGEPAALLDPAAEPPSRVGIGNVDYDAKGQRRRVDWKNGASTTYRYDEATSRLTHLYTRRGSSFAADCDNPQPPPPTVAAPDEPLPGTPCGVQNLQYVYDPVGNVVRITDAAQQTVFFRNRRVEPGNDYVYDALYRLVQASGREHLGQDLNGQANPPTAPDAFNAFHARLDHPGDGNALGSYVERYVYDLVGNISEVQHRGSDPAHPGWRRTYNYAEPSTLEDGTGGGPLKTSNRLSGTTLGTNEASAAEPYQHDIHGNVVRMPHLGGGTSAPNLHWDSADRLRKTDLGGGGAAFYLYDAAGERVRKVWEKSASLVDERIYLGGWEVFRRRHGPIGTGAVTLERETVHVTDDNGHIALVEVRTKDTAGTDPAPRRLVRHQLANHLGSAVLELDDQAQVISYEEYMPFGTTSYQAVRSQTDVPKRYRYTGKERDEESGLYHHTARYYAPWLGRWTAADPAGLVDGPCPYAYCRNNPVRLVDPSGTQGNASPFGLVGNDPRIGALWERAVVETLGPRFGTQNYAQTLAAFQAQVGTRTAAHGGNLGSNRRAGTAIQYARRTYSAVRTAFGRLAAQNGISLTGIQIHHTFDELARAPGQALTTTNLMFARGNAGTVGSGHNFAHQVSDALAQGARNPGQEVVRSLDAAGITPDVPELSATIRQPSANAAPAPHAPAAPAAAPRAAASSASRPARALTAARNMAGSVAQTAQRAAPTVARGVAATVRGGARVVGAAGRVVAPLAVAESSYRLATANNTLDRVQAGADTAAGLAAYAGPVGTAFAVGYGGGQLLDYGVEAATGESLSSRGARGMEAVDRAISSVLPENESLPEYKRENRIAWWLIDTFDL